MIRYASAVAAVAMLSSMANAQTRSQVYGSELEKQTMTLFVQGDTSMMAWDSGTAASKETKQTSTLTMGGWVGENRNVGIIMSSSDATVPFSLNDASLRVAQRDIRMKGRIGFVYPTVAATLTEVGVKATGEEVVDVYATGYGAGVEAQYPLHRMVLVTGEVLSFRIPNTYDKAGRDVAMGNRLEVDSNLNFDVTPRSVDLLVGYKYKKWSLEIEDESKDEKAQGAYLGLRMGLYF